MEYHGKNIDADSHLARYNDASSEIAIDLESSIVYDLIDRYNKVENELANMQCNPPEIPGFLDVGNEMNEMFKTVQGTETKVNQSLASCNKQLETVIDILRENDVVNYVDIDFLNYDTNSNESFLDKLLGWLIPSANAESALNLCGALSKLNENIFKTVWGAGCIIDGVFYNTIDGEVYSYNLNNGQLMLPNGKVVSVPGYITEGYTTMPSQNELVNPTDASNYLEAVDRLRIVMLLAGEADTSVLDKSFSLSNYGSTDEMLILAPEKDAHATYNQDDLLSIAKFFTYSLRANVASEGATGNFDCYAHSNSVGTLGKVLAKDKNDYINGNLGFYDYAPINVGNSRGQKVDQYSDDDLDYINSHLKRNNQTIVIYQANDSKNSSYISSFSSKVGNCEIRNVSEHGKRYFQDLLISELELYNK